MIWRVGIAAAVVIAVVGAVLILSTSGGGDVNETANSVQAVEGVDQDATTGAEVAGDPSSSPTPAPPPPTPSPTPTATQEEPPPTSPVTGDSVDDSGDPPPPPVDEPSGGRVLAATDLCGGWQEFSDTFVGMMGGDLLTGPDDSDAAYAYYNAAMQDLAELSPTDELRDAHLTLAAATLGQFTGEDADVDPNLEAASDLLDRELTQMCPGG